MKPGDLVRISYDCYAYIDNDNESAAFHGVLKCREYVIMKKHIQEDGDVT